MEPQTKKAKVDSAVESKENKDDGVKITNFDSWLETNRCNLVPPVCNKLMYGEQLKVMFCGGKDRNERTDYHIEEGEEFFWMLKGDMCLKVVEKGERKDIVIKEGECYLLPPRIPHSPQRVPDTIGLVVERDRKKTETDCLRWYVPNTTDVLWEKYFYCADLGTELPPVINAFKASQSAKTLTPNLEDGTVLKDAHRPVKVDLERELTGPVSFTQWCAQQDQQALQQGVTMFQGDDFKVTVFKGLSAGSEAGAVGKSTEYKNAEVYVYQISGSATLTTPAATHDLASSSMVIVPPGAPYSCSNKEEGALRMELVWTTA